MAIIFSTRLFFLLINVFNLHVIFRQKEVTQDSSLVWVVLFYSVLLLIIWVIFI